MVDKATIFIATTNRGKLREVRAILADLPLEFTALDDHATFPAPCEDADSFEGNARLKALHYALLANCWALADDSGLEVDALGGEPGIYSARWAWPGCTPADNNAKLTQKLANVPFEERTARYRCAIALADPTEVRATAIGTLEGLILTEPRGANGFGYDPHFLVPEAGLTAAEMTPGQKNLISHRRRALELIRPAVSRLLVASRA
ncbi:MAG: RdgB/HAM1 family non-canonical purine NTP pyrophosphatase [Phycisphaerales bacterium]|nr:MAG: RdgB/HAM1 family non-canonical purine NTP pyrophosphatase [Phycisphaerales bacterium]